MAQKIGYGYGSEWHLLRFLGYHRRYLNDQINEQTGLEVINWLDFNFSGKKKRYKQDEEYKGLNFLDEKQYSIIEYEWKKFWPKSGNQQNWDAVGKAKNGNSDNWVLVEAKANIQECKSICKAKPASKKGGRDQITNTMLEVIKTTAKSENIDPEKWLNKYYQYANRLALLHFLIKSGINANLLFIYFIGDDNKDAKCPDSVSGWKEVVSNIHNHLEIDTDSDLMGSVKHLYLPIYKKL